ncbi:MAG TPA: hypothetical protein VGI48_04565 [Caldimonas sp.]|jgi:hypothetical protein
MRRVLLPSAFLGAALLLLAVPAAQAIGFGRGVTSTTLGAPLDFSAQLAVDNDEMPARECVAAEVRVGDARLAPEQVRATIENGPRPGDRRVRVTTRSAIDEPVVTIDVTVGCLSRMSRRFVAFVDPPTLHLASAGDDFTPQRVDPQVAPLVDIVNAATRRGGREKARQRDEAPVAQVAAAARKRHDKTLAASTAPAAAARPRLRLDPAPVLQARAPAPIASAPAPAAATQVATATPADAVPAADAASAMGAAERARIDGLETLLARLRGESQAQQKTLGAVQARLRDAEGERYANGLVYVLAIGMLFFAVLAWAFWALRPRQRRNARWLEANARQLREAAAPAAAAAAAAAAEADPKTPRVSQPPSGWDEAPQSLVPVTAPASIGGLEVTTVLAPQSHYARMAREQASANTAQASAASAWSPMEDLLDLEQQAEFFAVLGQDDAAAALLNAHLRDHRDGCPLPFLHLLEIHRRRDQRGAFERARSEHGEQFEGVASEWDDAADASASLAAHAETMAQVQMLWTTPSEAMRLLERLLFRRGGSDAVFDLAGCRDLLFLYSVARDLAGQADAADGSVDLYLPFDDAPTEPWPRDAGGHAVDVDVSGWPDMPDEPLVIRRSAGGRAG